MHWAELVDLEHQTVSPLVFVDPEVYRAEQERIFARCWLYVAHETQIPRPGDFVTNYMGQEQVIVCRDGEGQVRVFVNSCRHRGMRVCRTDEGHTRLFQCPRCASRCPEKGCQLHRMDDPRKPDCSA